jgi:uncharacterized OB-fold protein
VSLRVFVCEACGRAVFPRRLLCPDCGGSEWRPEAVEAGVLESVADQGDVRLGAVRTPLGPLVIARVEGEQQAGVEVSLDADGDVPVAGR